MNSYPIETVCVCVCVCVLTKKAGIDFLHIRQAKQAMLPGELAILNDRQILVFQTLNEQYSFFYTVRPPTGEGNGTAVLLIFACVICSRVVHVFLVLFRVILVLEGAG